jgi:diketogulonate reductase-like aldo/keto reductase
LGEGKVFDKVRNMPLPFWAEEYSIKSWSQFFLLYIISHPGVTAVIPATANPDHARENFSVADMALPDQNFRRRMAEFADKL